MKFLEKYKERPKELFPMLFWNFLFAYLPFSLLAAFLSLFEIVPVNFNDEPTYGIKGFLVVILFTPFMILGFTLLTWIYFRMGNFFLRVFIKTFS